jgi:uncharacterized protein YukJ
MPIQRYSVLKGKPKAIAPDANDDPHMSVLVDAGGVSHRVAINISSGQPPYALLYKVVQNWDNHRIAALAALPEGRVRISSQPGLALDYIRGSLVQQQEMNVAPFSIGHPRNGLRNALVPMLEKAIADGGIELYAFGQAWEDESSPDQVFGFTPGNGIHNIHLNQGSSGARQTGSNGVHQDGALVLHDLDSDSWTAIFFAFQGQSWDTDSLGFPLLPGGPARDPDPKPRTAGSLRIVAALINAQEPPEGQESVTLLNLADCAMDLSGMAVEIGDGRREPLAGALPAGESLRVMLPPRLLPLRDRRGTIKLVNPSGSVIDSVSCTKNDVGPDGWTVVFR